MIDRPLTQTAAPVAKGSDSSRPRMVSIEITVTLQGLPGSNSSEAPAFYEETRTVTVSAHGAVVRLSAMPKPGQKVLMTNTRMLSEVLCRVVQSRGNVDAQNHVELEFVQASPGFWGISFPSEAPGRLQAPMGAPSAAGKMPVVPSRASHASAPAPARSGGANGAQAVASMRSVAVAAPAPAPELVPIAEPVKRREVPLAPPRPVVAAREPSHIRVANPAPSALATSAPEAATTPVIVRLPRLGESARFAREERSSRKWIFLGAAAVAVT